VRTPKEAQFWAYWLDNWPKPAHVNAANIEDGSTPYSWFRDWLNQERTSLNLVLEVLKEFEDSNYAPKFGRIKSLYNRKVGLVGKVDATKRCEVCDNTGIIEVAMCPKNDGSGGYRVISKPAPVVGIVLNSVPCKCSVGHRVNDRPGYQYDYNLLSKLFKHRITPAKYHALIEECRKLRGDSKVESKRVKRDQGKEQEWHDWLSRMSMQKLHDTSEQPARVVEDRFDDDEGWA